MKKSFVLYHDQHECIEDLTNDQKGQLLDMMFFYGKGEPLPEYDPVVKIAFKFFKIVFDRDNVKWEKKAASNKENGKKGGRPKKSKNKDLDETQENPEEPKKPTGFPKNPSKPKKAVSGSGSVNANVKKEHPWLDINLFESFVQDRIDRKKAPTEKAIELMVSKLEKCCEGNYDLQEQIINKSIESGWTTFYKLNESEKPKKTSSEESWRKAL